jgi:hypothetical protein
MSLSEELEGALGERWGWQPAGNVKQSVNVLVREVNELRDSVKFMADGISSHNDLHSEAGAKSALKSANTIRAILKRMA